MALQALRAHFDLPAAPEPPPRAPEPPPPPNYRQIREPTRFFRDFRAYYHSSEGKKARDWGPLEPIFEGIDLEDRNAVPDWVRAHIPWVLQMGQRTRWRLRNRVRRSVGGGNR